MLPSARISCPGTIRTLSGGGSRLHEALTATNFTWRERIADVYRADTASEARNAKPGARASADVDPFPPLRYSYGFPKTLTYNRPRATASSCFMSEQYIFTIENL